MKKAKVNPQDSRLPRSPALTRVARKTPRLLREVLEAASQRLSEAGSDTPRLDAEVLLAFALAKDRTWLYVHPTESLNDQDLHHFWDLLRRREERQPVAYITGSKEFFGLEFEVNQHVLIPRPETELLVETALEIAGDWRQEEADQPPRTVADIGAGSGCIAVALAKSLPAVQFYAVDISPRALALARDNASRHQVTGQIAFCWGNLLQPLPGPVDMIVSNPPYVSHANLMGRAIQPEVIQYEPRLALDGGEAGLELLARLIAHAPTRLKPRGSLLVEIGADQGQAVTWLAQASFPRATIQVKKDLAQLDRLLVVRT